MNNKLTGSFISQRRKELGLNQKQLAEKLNVTDKAVSKWETGRSAPDISLLVPLSETLEVSVIEILKGEKTEKEALPALSGEVVVETMKKGKRKTIIAVILSVAVMLTLISLCAAAFVGHHYFNSVPVDDETNIIEETSDGWSSYDYCEGEGKIVKSVKKGDYYFYLVRYDKSVVLSVFKKDELFEDRILYEGGTCATKENFVELHSFGENGLTINAFIGFGMTDESYAYYYRGVKSEKKIEGEYILDVLIDVNDSYTYPLIVYDN